MTLATAIYRTAWIALTISLVWLFKETAYLALLLFLPLLGRHRPIKRSTAQHFQELGLKIDALAETILTTQGKDK